MAYEKLSNDDQGNPDAAKWQNLGNKENKGLNPEQLRETAKMVERLGDMGVDSRILENPAFVRTIGGLINDYGLKMSKEGLVEATEEDKKLSLAYIGEKGGGTNNHDRGNMNFTVNEKGELVIESAYADARGETLKEIDVTKLTNDFQKTSFKILESGDLEIREENTYEQQYAQNHGHIGHEENALYHIGAGDERRVFDSKGIEQSREIIDYKGWDAENEVSLPIRISSSDGRPETVANFATSRRPKELERRVTAIRNEDGTVRIEAWRNGKKYKNDSAPLIGGGEEIFVANDAIWGSGEA